MPKTTAQIQRERVNELEHRVMDALDSGPMPRRDLWRATRQPGVCDTDFTRVVNRLRRGGFVRFTNFGKPDETIELSPEWRS